jgi:hypothetical protein
MSSVGMEKVQDVVRREIASSQAENGAGVRRDALLLFLLSLAVRLVMAALLPRPGYMDVAYYAAGAVQLAEGGGLSEPFLWNYMEDPAGLPHPGFLYWQPLPSLLAALPALLVPGSFFALQLPFVLASALLPLLGYAAGRGVGGVRRHGWIAGLLTLFSGFFFPYWTLPETFAPFALFGGLALWLAGRGPDVGWRLAGGGRWLLAGLLVGLAHLTRADGILLLPVVSLGLLLCRFADLRIHRFSSFILHCSLLLAGYLLAMGPWFARNLAVAGAPLSPAGGRALWLTDYDDLFCYGCDLSPRAYLAWGWSNILRSKLWAAGVNLQRFAAEDCMVFLLPFVCVGMYRLRHRLSFSLSMVYLGLAFALHSFAFTFPGARGGYFHASAPVLPFLFAAGVEGLDVAVRWAGRWRRWNLQRAVVVFSVAVVVAALALSVYVADTVLPRWREADRVYEEVDHWLAGRGAGESVVMVNNPPAFWYHTRRPAVVVPAPGGGVEALLAAAERYGVTHVVLDRNWPLPPKRPSHWPLRQVAGWGEGTSRVALYEVEVR